MKTKEKSIKIYAKDVSYIMFYPDDPDYKIFKKMPNAVVCDEGLETEYLVFYTISEEKIVDLIDI